MRYIKKTTPRHIMLTLPVIIGKHKILKAQFKEMQTGTTVRYYYTHIRRDRIKKTDYTKCW